MKNLQNNLLNLIDLGHFQICKNLEFSNEKNMNCAFPTKFSRGTKPTTLINLLS